jgi:hypothetical protein
MANDMALPWPIPSSPPSIFRAALLARIEEVSFEQICNDLLARLQQLLPDFDAVDIDPAAKVIEG